MNNRNKQIGFNSVNELHKGWRELVSNGLDEIESNMWNKFIPTFIKVLIHNKAIKSEPNSIWFRLRTYLTDGQIITQIKTKFGDLRIYGKFNEKNQKVVEVLLIECEKTCELCGSKHEVKKRSLNGWLYTMCDKCYNS